MSDVKRNAAAAFQILGTEKHQQLPSAARLEMSHDLFGGELLARNMRAVGAGNIASAQTFGCRHSLGKSLEARRRLPKMHC